jgi:predicted ATPase
METTFVVELLGAAGSGKSGLANALSAGPGTVVVKEHAAGDVTALLRAVPPALPALKAGPPSDVSRARWTAWAVRLCAARAVVHRHAPAHGGLVVLDQGPAYTLGRMLSMRADVDGNHWWHQQAAATARLIDVLVILEAEPAELRRRLRRRSKNHRASTMSDPELGAYLRSEHAICSSVAQAIAQAGSRVIRVDTGRLSVAEQVEVTRGGLTAICRRTGRPV